MSYSSYSPSSPSTPTFAGCKYRKALLRGFRPSAQNQKVIYGVCPSRCIYCDIWKLATLVYCHAPAALKSPSRQSSSSSSSTLSRSSSSASNSSDSEDEMSIKAIQAAFQAQRARLASILSICTVEGADECDGLRLAHDRCLMSVMDLINKDRVLQEQAAPVRHEYPVQMESTPRPLSSRRSSRDCGSATMRERYLSGSREGSHMGLAR